MSSNKYSFLDLKKFMNTNNLDEFLDLFESLKNLKTTQQDKKFHGEGDVWTHTKMVINELKESKKFQDFTEESKFICFYSALFHDIAKPLCTKTIDGKIISPGHSKKGEIDTRIILWENNVPFKIREEICNIIAYHQVPFFTFKSKNKTPEFICHELSHSMLKNKHLLEVARADMKGRIFAEKKECLDDIDLFEELINEEKCLYDKKIFPDEHTRVQYFKTLGKISPNYTFFKGSEGSNVILMCGLPASGKNTWIEKNYPNMQTVSFDDMKKEMNLKENDNVGTAVHATIEKAKNLLRKKEPFIWNATNIQEDMRLKTIDLLHNYNANINIVYLETSYENLFERNLNRDSSLNNKKLKNMLLKWTIPTEKEVEKINYEVEMVKNNKKLRNMN